MQKGPAETGPFPINVKEARAFLFSLFLGRFLFAFDDFLRRGAFFEQFFRRNTPKGRRHPLVRFSLQASARIGLAASAQAHPAAIASLAR